jgi:hypothetical protein
MSDLPEFVYLIAVDGEWPVSAVASDHPSTERWVAERVEAEVARRRQSSNVWHDGQIHVWKARLTDLREMDLLPAATVKPSLRERPQP